MATSTIAPGSIELRTSRIFDCDSFFEALDERRSSRGLDWNELAAELWRQSSALNAQLMDHAICPGAVVRVSRRGTISCQYALTMLRWMSRSPEEFLLGTAVDVGDVRLPAAGPDSRLRWNLNELYTALDEERVERNLTWTRLAHIHGCTPSRLTNLRTARLADMDLVMSITQWLRRPAASFIHPAAW